MNKKNPDYILSHIVVPILQNTLFVCIFISTWYLPYQQRSNVSAFYKNEMHRIFYTLYFYKMMFMTDIYIFSFWKFSLYIMFVVDEMNKLMNINFGVIIETYIFYTVNNYNRLENTFTVVLLLLKERIHQFSLLINQNIHVDFLILFCIIKRLYFF